MLASKNYEASPQTVDLCKSLFQKNVISFTITLLKGSNQFTSEKISIINTGRSKQGKGERDFCLEENPVLSVRLN